VQAILSLAHSLGLEVVAEGVEREEQAEALIRMRCDVMQGYFFAPPQPAVNVPELIRMVHSPWASKAAVGKASA
jgi:EAL domain-containing protein (putative c-di-GMP-specific phosphodiesterase class I)